MQKPASLTGAPVAIWRLFKLLDHAVLQHRSNEEPLKPTPKQAGLTHQDLDVAPARFGHHEFVNHSSAPLASVFRYEARLFLSQALRQERRP